MRPVTPRRDLRTGRSYWARPQRVPVRKLARDITTDVLVVGAGISGAVIAEALSRRFDVVVVDRRGPSLGATAASTALVVYEIDMPLTRLHRRIGKEKAARAWQRSHAALAALMARTRELGIACEAARRDCLYLTGDVLCSRSMRRETAARRAIGLETLYLSQAALMARFGIRRRGALLAYDDFAVNPVRMAEGYLAAAIDNGAKLHAPVDVAEVEASRGGVLAGTAGGPTIRAKHLILATGYELPAWVPGNRHRVVSTYAIATGPQPRHRLWPGPALIWEASDPYLYIRTTRSGRVICGGEDEDYAGDEQRDALIPKKATTISNKLKRLLPALDARAALAWAGAFGTTTTGLPSIGELPGHPNCWAVVGFGGNGMTYSRIAADIIDAALDGCADPDSDIYAFAQP